MIYKMMSKRAAIFWLHITARRLNFLAEQAIARPLGRHHQTVYGAYYTAGDECFWYYTI